MLRGGLSRSGRQDIPAGKLLAAGGGGRQAEDAVMMFGTWSTTHQVNDDKEKYCNSSEKNSNH